MSVSVYKATQDDLHDLIPLLDAYRGFYKQESDLRAAEIFLKARFTIGDSTILVGKINGSAVGFIQLYPSFSTVSLKPLYILNDLFVTPAYRSMGIGEKLLSKAQELCAKKGFKGLALETGVDNPAQALYERMGWKKDIHCFHYFWSVP